MITPQIPFLWCRKKTASDTTVYFIWRFRNYLKGFILWNKNSEVQGEKMLTTAMTASKLHKKINPVNYLNWNKIFPLLRSLHQREAEHLSLCFFCLLSHLLLMEEWGFRRLKANLLYKTSPRCNECLVCNFTSGRQIDCVLYLVEIARWWNDTLLLSQAVSQEATAAWWENGWRLLWSTLSLTLLFFPFST